MTFSQIELYFLLQDRLVGLSIMNEIKESSRKRILDTAAELFASKGYDTVGVAEICMVSNASKGAFYHHFESKESLFMELLDQWLVKLDTQLYKILKQDLSLDLGIHAILGILKEVSKESSKQYSIFLEFYTKAIRNEKVYRRLDMEMKKYQNLLSSLIQKGIDEKILKPVDPLSTSKSVIALVMGLLMEGWLTRNEEGKDSLFKFAIDNFLEGFKL